MPKKRTTGKGKRYTAEQVQKGLQSIQTMTSVEQFEYVITSVPHNCTAYHVDDVIVLWFQAPPPARVVLNYGEPCDGIVADLLT